MDSSDEDGVMLMAAFKKGGQTEGNSPMRKQESALVEKNTFNRMSREDTSSEGSPPQPRQFKRALVAVNVPPVRRRHEYTYYEPKETVERILRESRRQGKYVYKIEIVGGTTKEVRELKRSRPLTCPPGLCSSIALSVD
jgi:hypothetical protein